VNPVVKDDLAMVSEQKGDDHEQIDIIKQRLAQYQRLKKTHYYRVVSELADPMIKHLESDLAKPRGAFPNVPTDVLQEQRAEWRGMLAVWIQLRDEPHFLEDQLRKYTEGKGKENGDKEKKMLKVDKYV
jgi:hypothetical protein